jgi:hypothetical protein
MRQLVLTSQSWYELYTAVSIPFLLKHFLEPQLVDRKVLRVLGFIVGVG